MTSWVALAGWMLAGTTTTLAAPAEPEAAATAPPAGGEAVPSAPPPSPAEAAEAPTPEEGSAPEAAGEAAPEGAEASTPEDTPVEPAPLPPSGAPAPAAAEPRAWGGAHEAPLPEPPEAADPSTRVTTPWRGRFWLGVGLGGSFPLGGRPPAAGGVIAVFGEVDLGWRVNRFLGLHTAISSFAHDAARQTVVGADGAPIQEVELGRITAFDLVTARVFAPVHRRIDPWAEVGLGVAARRGPFAAQRQAAGLVRVGAGVDFWVAPTLTLGVSTVYRTIIIGDAVGHGLRAGADFGIHW